MILRKTLIVGKKRHLIHRLYFFRKFVLLAKTVRKTRIQVYHAFLAHVHMVFQISWDLKINLFKTIPDC